MTSVRRGPSETLSTRISERKAALLQVLRLELAEETGDVDFRKTKGRIVEYAIDQLLLARGKITPEEAR